MTRRPPLPPRVRVQWLDGFGCPASFPNRMPVVTVRYGLSTPRGPYTALDLDLGELRRHYHAREYRKATGGFDGCP